MKNCVIYILACLFLVGCGSDQSNLKTELKDDSTLINIQFDTLINGELVLSRLGVKKQIALDTVKVIEGKAVFNVDLKQPSFLNVFFKNESGGAIIFSHPGDHSFVKSKDQNLTYGAQISGTPEIERLNRFISFMNGYRYYVDSLKFVYKEAAQRNEHFQLEESFQNLYVGATKKMEDFTKDFIYKNPNQLINLQAVRSLDAKRFSKVYSFVDSVLYEKFPTSDYVVDYHLNQLKQTATNVNQSAPNFTLPDLEGNKKSLLDFKGKYVLLDFWATWCRPCIKEIPYLEKAYTKHGGDDFEILSVCIDKPGQIASWKRIVEDHQANWTQLFDGTGSVSKLYRIQYFPTILLLDPNGKIIAKDLRGDGIVKELDKIFSK